MSLFDAEALLLPVSDDAPCGPDLRGEPDFRDIEDAPGGFANLKPPELAKVVKQCADVLTRSKDQMPAIVAVQAALRAGDVAEANAALNYVVQLAERYWDDFHPGPAEEMLIGRVNELSALTRPAAMVLPLQRLAMASMPAPSSAAFTAQMLTKALEPVPEWKSSDDTELQQKQDSGALTAAAARNEKSVHEGARQLRLIMIALSEDARAADRAAETLPASFNPAQAEPVALQLREQVSIRRGELQTMSDLLYTLTETYERRASDAPGFGPVLSQIKSMLAAADGLLQAFPDPSAVSTAEMVAEEGEVPPADSSAAVAVPSAKPRGFSGDVPQTRTDVLTAIDAINKYYATHEPTSPVPLMLRRIRDWVEMDFIHLLREIAPNSLDDARKLLAIRDE